MLKGGRRGIRAVVAVALFAMATPAVGAAPTGGDAELAQLINATDNPLPIVPIMVPQLQSTQEVDELLAPGKRPILFQISQPGGPYADPDKIRFFEMLSVEYALRVTFRKVAAGSPAAGHLYHDVTKPVYLLCDPSNSNGNKCAFIDEAEMPKGGEVKQTTLENFIYRTLAIAPTLLTTFGLTPANAQSTIFDYQPELPNPAPTAKWIVVLFFRSEATAPGPVNRLRVLMALETFFYANRLRTAECDISKGPEVYPSLLGDDTTQLPTGPELWLINPATQQAIKYVAAGSSPPLADLTHAAFEAWLAGKGVASPPDDAIDSAAAWRELAKLYHRTKAN
jgi:hypothetical protein